MLTNRIFVFAESLVEQRLIVEIALVHAQLVHQSIRRIDSITHPRDITDVVFLALIEIQVDIHVFGVHRHHRITHHQRITISPTVHFINEETLIFLILFGTEFTRSESNPLFESRAVARLLHRILQRIHQIRIYSHDMNLTNQNFIILIDIDVHNHVVVGCHIFMLHHIHFDILVALLFKILLNAELCAIHKVRGHLIAHPQWHTLLQFFTL